MFRFADKFSNNSYQFEYIYNIFFNEFLSSIIISSSFNQNSVCLYFLFLFEYSRFGADCLSINSQQPKSVRKNIDDKNELQVVKWLSIKSMSQQLVTTSPFALKSRSRLIRATERRADLYGKWTPHEVNDMNGNPNRF